MKSALALSTTLALVLLAGIAIPVAAEEEAPTVEAPAQQDHEAFLTFLARGGGGGTASLTCNASTQCPWGQTLSCSCPGIGTCINNGPDVSCDCSGTSNDFEDSCCDYIGSPLPPHKCNANAKCDDRCGAVCGFGTCINGRCNCLA